MKKFLPFLTLFSLISISVDAQNNVRLTINHKLGDNAFALNTAAENNIGHSFKVSRLQYYVSKISIQHDGGLETAIEDLYILVNAAEMTEVDLGSHEINVVEQLTFRVGVDEEHNHLDPASWPSDHPLAPTFPSMHWGWAAGYRFIALEGKAGPNLNQTFEMHCLGDQNYYRTIVPMSAVAENGELNISIDADYTRALEDIPVNGGIIVHGETDEAVDVIDNFRFYVFSPSPGFTSTLDKAAIKKFNVFPNPALEGRSQVVLETEGNQVYQLSITDLLGRQVQHFDGVRSGDQVGLNLEFNGIYFVNLVKNGQIVLSEKLISKR